MRSSANNGEPFFSLRCPFRGYKQPWKLLASTLQACGKLLASSVIFMASHVLANRWRVGFITKHAIENPAQVPLYNIKREQALLNGFDFACCAWISCLNGIHASCTRGTFPCHAQYIKVPLCRTSSLPVSRILPARFSRTTNLVLKKGIACCAGTACCAGHSLLR